MKLAQIQEMVSAILHCSNSTTTPTSTSTIPSQTRFVYNPNTPFRLQIPDSAKQDHLRGKYVSNSTFSNTGAYYPRAVLTSDHAEANLYRIDGNGNLSIDMTGQGNSFDLAYEEAFPVETKDLVHVFYYNISERYHTRSGPFSISSDGRLILEGEVGVGFKFLGWYACDWGTSIISLYMYRYIGSDLMKPLPCTCDEVQLQVVLGS